MLPLVRRLAVSRQPGGLRHLAAAASAGSSGGRFPKGTTIKSDPSKYTTIDFAAAQGGGGKKPSSASSPKKAPSPSPSSPQPSSSSSSSSSSGPQSLRVNEDITGVKEARLIHGETGETIGVLLPFEDCLAEAAKRELDLIEVSKSPPVLKLADFAKLVEQRREQRQKVQSLMGFKPPSSSSTAAAAAAAAGGLEEVKEVHMGTNIENHDFEMKRELMKKFLGKRHPIKLVLKFRRSAHLKMDDRPARARQLVERLQTELREFIAPEENKQKPKDQQGTLIKVFFPIVEGASPKKSKPPKQPQPQPQSQDAAAAATPSKPSSA